MILGRRFRSGPWLVALALVLAVGGGRAVVAGGLNVLAAHSAVSPEMLRKFEHESGIAVSLTETGEHGDVVARLAEVSSGFDIAFLPDHHVAELIDRGLLERILADRLPGFWNVEDPWRSRSFDPRNEYTIPHQWGTTAFAVDTSLHRGDIDTLRLLFDPPPDIADRIAIKDDSDMVRLALLYLGEPRCATDSARLEKAAQVLARLLATARLVAPDHVVEALISPGIVLGVAWNGDALHAREIRPELAYAYPREGNLVWTDVAAVPRNPPNRANALKFLAFLLKPENAALESNFNGYANMIRGSEAHMLPQVLGSPELVAPWPAKVGFFVSCGGVVQHLHDQTWDRAKLRASAKAMPRGHGVR